QARRLTAHDPINVNEFRESVCIRDDIDAISDKKIREAVYNILDQILEIGRHFKIHCIVTNHPPTNGKDTRRIFHEANTVTYFHHSAGGKIKYLLEEYVGLDRKQVAYVSDRGPEPVQYSRTTRSATCCRTRQVCWT
ncbi:MAG: hypothetical protein ACKPKO_06230, partial [Candidatus Fonsibacter sp.]